MRETPAQKPATSNRHGFTIIEALIATAIFSVAATLIVGIMVSAIRVRRKIGDIQRVQDTARFGTELITKEMRVGDTFRLDQTTCGIGAPETEIYFITYNNITDAREQRIYFLNAAGVIMRITAPETPALNNSACPSALAFTPDSIAIESLRFRLRGQTPGPTDGQPYVTIALTARAANPAVASASRMRTQTMIVQRLRDL
ncbi:MAG: prepilin-type N-terminal cleavage/methylation domain-containing protein [Patescibacteria group bacterium]